MATAEQPSNVAATLRNRPLVNNPEGRAAKRFGLAGGGPAETVSERQRHDRLRRERGNSMGQAVPF